MLTWLSLGAVALTFQACYGVPQVSLNGTVKSADTKEPIPGIQVSVYENDYSVTNGNGKYQLFVEDWEQTVLFKDIDGPENGEFQDKVVTWRPRSGPLNVELERK
jgi:hypothetical protein